MSLRIRALRPDDVAAADRIYRVAFGTLLGLPDPAAFRGDAELIRSRTRSYPDGGFVAELDDEIVGVSLANDWGSLGLLGPVAVHPRHWNQGVAKRLLEPTVETFGRWRSRLVGLFTFPDPGHLHLYQSFGFWPRYLTAVMSRLAAETEPVPGAILLAADPARSAGLVEGCQALAATIYPGLDLRREIDSLITQSLGDVLVLLDAAEVAGFALCHCGKGSEGGSQNCYLKFALVRSGGDAPQLLSRLIAAAQRFARSRGAAQLVAGVSAGRHGAHRLLIELGFRTQLQGVAMHRPWREAYDRPEIYALDDWR